MVCNVSRFEDEYAAGSGAENANPVDSIQQYVSENKSAVGRMVTGEFEISTLSEAEKLSTMLANNTPCPDKASIGFWELISNAIEHGNLEIDMDKKTELLLAGQLEVEVLRRLKVEPYCHRLARVDFRRHSNAIHLRVVDEGPGFDFKAVLASDFEHSRPNGRGIHVAQSLCFDTISYLGNGNTVEAVISL